LARSEFLLRSRGAKFWQHFALGRYDLDHFAVLPQTWVSPLPLHNGFVNSLWGHPVSPFRVCRDWGFSFFRVSFVATTLASVESMSFPLTHSLFSSHDLGFWIFFSSLTHWGRGSLLSGVMSKSLSLLPLVIPGFDCCCFGLEANKSHPLLFDRLFLQFGLFLCGFHTFKNFPSHHFACGHLPFILS